MMKRIIVIAFVLLSTSVLFAQNDSVFFKHELRISLGDAIVTSVNRLDGSDYTNFSLSYFYRFDEVSWIGINFINYFGEKTYYDWREYDVNGKFKDFSKSKMKYCAIMAPEIRLSCVNKKAVIIYGAFSGGIGFENGYDHKEQKYPNRFYCLHVTLFGISCNFGNNNNIFFGGELGLGFKGLGSIHCGYRF